MAILVGVEFCGDSFFFDDLASAISCLASCSYNSPESLNSTISNPLSIFSPGGIQGSHNDRLASFIAKSTKC